MLKILDDVQRHYLAFYTTFGNRKTSSRPLDDAFTDGNVDLLIVYAFVTREKQTNVH